MRIPHGLRAALAGQVSGGATDPYFSDVSLLMHGDGTNGSTTFVDSSSNNFTITPAGNAQVSTTQSKFGGASMYFDGNGDYATAASNAAFAFGTGDFTIEFWLQLASTQTGNRMLCDLRPANGTYVVPTIYLNGGVLSYYTNGLDRITGSSISTLAWHHIALCRSNGSTRLFVNGVQVGSTYADANNYIQAPVLLGGYSYLVGYDSNCYIDDLRITKGVARYTANFTPPTAAFPDA